jgi:hypothetical protein
MSGQSPDPTAEIVRLIGQPGGAKAGSLFPHVEEMRKQYGEPVANLLWSLYDVNTELNRKLSEADVRQALAKQQTAASINVHGGTVLMGTNQRIGEVGMPASRGTQTKPLLIKYAASFAGLLLIALLVLAVRDEQRRETMLASAFGVIALGTLFVTMIVIPHPTSSQYTTMRIMLALSCACIAGLIPGIIQLNWHGWLRATGALAVFCVVYLVRPARATPNPPDPAAEFIEPRHPKEDLSR